MEKDNKIQLKKCGNVTLIEVRGDVTTSSETFLNEAYKGACDQGTSGLLFKFDENAYINSGGIGVLIQIIAESKGNNKKIGIIGLSEHYKKIFNLVGITKFANIYGSMDEGLNGLSET